MNSLKLASIILRGPFELEEVSLRLEGVLVGDLLEEFVVEMIAAFGEGCRPPIGALSKWISRYNEPEIEDDEDEELWEEDWDDEDDTERLEFSGDPDLRPAQMAPDRFISADWKVPSITTLGALAHWLDLPVEYLDWFCGQVRPAEVGSKLSHYHVVKIAKRSGGTRLLEVPKWEMKQAQRYVLDGILAQIPSHDCSHGFQRGRSIVSYVEPHVGRQVIVKFDLRDYFLTADRARVRSLFHLAGYPPHISYYLASLCTHGFRMEGVSNWKYECAHLPQGAPSSPAIADRLLFKMDVRLQGLAEKMGLEYTRYADDLAFSSEVKMKPQEIEGLKRVVDTIVSDEGWILNAKKTRVMHASQRQRLAGLVVNSKANLARSEYETLKAILHRVGHNGLEAENRENHPNFLAHLEGRVSFVCMVNRSKGEKLMAMLQKG